MEREPEEPVGEGVGLITCWGLGVPGGPEPMPLCAPPLELSLLFCPISSWKGKRQAEPVPLLECIQSSAMASNAGRQVAFFVVFIHLNESDSNYELAKRQPQLKQMPTHTDMEHEHMTERRFGLVVVAGQRKHIHGNQMFWVGISTHSDAKC